MAWILLNPNIPRTCAVVTIPITRRNYFENCSSVFLDIRIDFKVNNSRERCCGLYVISHSLPIEIPLKFRRFIQPPPSQAPLGADVNPYVGTATLSWKCRNRIQGSSPLILISGTILIKMLTDCIYQASHLSFNPSCSAPFSELLYTFCQKFAGLKFLFLLKS